MPAISQEPAVPSKLMDVISSGCKAEGKHVVEAMSSGDYCVPATVSAKEA